MTSLIKRLSFLLLGILTPVLLSSQSSGLQSPDDFLPYRHGERFSPHHLLVDYFEHVAANSNRLTLRAYGFTSEGRPLIYGIVSTPANLERIEQIRENHLRKTGLLEGATDDSDLAIVWLSYGVHGNEAAASESAIATVYELTRTDRSDVQKWLENTIVIIDPCLNPDGYSRYTHWNIGASNTITNPNPASREHNEPWPGGRVNHYLFDLNRDWAWQTQLETRQRIKAYQQWMPHVHVDFHEMGYNDPYYFAPAAQPYHNYITEWQGVFQQDVGRNNAKYFDEKGWTYFTREIFDLLYPSYGDTYPIFNGAIGMTYEQGGHSRAGKAILLENGDTLRLIDRINHHVVTGLSTIEVSAQNATELNKNFLDYFKKSKSSPEGPYKSYVIKNSNDPAKIKALCDLLDRNQIRYGRLGNAKNSLTGFDYQTRASGSLNVGGDDLVISAYQPMSVLVQVLFDPDVDLVDSLTYDITAWALPYAYGLEAYALKTRLNPDQAYRFSTTSEWSPRKTKDYAYLAKWSSLNSVRFLSALHQQGIRVRCASADFVLEGKPYNKGTLVITRADNKKLDDRLGERIATIAKDIGQEVTAKPVLTAVT
ncbi:MAG: M14 family zinc carboxypeptidase, partial [Bacteroidota bacterium]